ncbi:MAG: histidine kinase [Desulfobacteraceae bacterium 4484_190.1]|nr:MAG: histidine kinase [Desulfobacteraceae bacterium 4484_190.1]
MNVQDIMTTRIECVDAESSVYDAVEKMVDKRIRSLVVKFPGKKINYGVITARDIVFKVFSKGMNPNDVKNSEIASKPVVCIDQGTDLIEAAKTMTNSNIARVFVCDGDNIIGVVALIDLMSAALIMRARGEDVP